MWNRRCENTFMGTITTEKEIRPLKKKNIIQTGR